MRMWFRRNRADVETDVLVVGTGGAGLAAGLAAHHRGARVTLIEKAAQVGGMPAMTVAEATEWGVFSRPRALPWKLLGKRFSDGLVSYGGALVGGLLKGLLDRGVEPQLEVAARELVVENGRVVGLKAQRAGA